MADFLFQFELADFTAEVAATIPQHREHINRLLADGMIRSYSVSLQRNMIWCVISAGEEQQAMEMALALPLYPYFTDVSCHPLLFHNVVPATLPGISLN